MAWEGYPRRLRHGHISAFNDDIGIIPRTEMISPGDSFSVSKQSPNEPQNDRAPEYLARIMRVLIWDHIHQARHTLASSFKPIAAGPIIASLEVPRATCQQPLEAHRL
ncbi:predicted protein [Coccidioides posadasii str. Silveira]|uniref:Predicted protein n=1 Tax=Coccidioides posadasii (strain RMSCC 757 / Silveira) TaxID=443226 RepID=E9CV97_COCPS|nr:predicted protein [Coccidioides posadasii str. Silveira]